MANSPQSRCLASLDKDVRITFCAPSSRDDTSIPPPGPVEEELDAAFVIKNSSESRQ
jgi:hypothetical protein